MQSPPTNRTTPQMTNATTTATIGASNATGPTVNQRRLGDSLDRRRCFGNIYTQQIMPWDKGEARLGDSMDRRRCFGNIYTQRSPNIHLGNIDDNEDLPRWLFAE